MAAAHTVAVERRYGGWNQHEKDVQLPWRLAASIWRRDDDVVDQNKPIKLSNVLVSTGFLCQVRWRRGVGAETHLYIKTPPLPSSINQCSLNTPFSHHPV